MVLLVAIFREFLEIFLRKIKKQGPEHFVLWYILEKHLQMYAFVGVGGKSLLVMYMFGERPGSKLKRVPSVYLFTVFEFYDVFVFHLKKKNSQQELAE